MLLRKRMAHAKAYGCCESNIFRVFTNCSLELDKKRSGEIVFSDEALFIVISTLYYLRLQNYIARVKYPNFFPHK